jgi:apolipoprotein N-acyltransferase
MESALTIAPLAPGAPRDHAESATTPPATWWRSTLALALVGYVLLWAALPPLAMWPLAWLAPVAWVLLVRQPTLSGKRPYAMLWLASFVFWLAALYWVTLPHWATSFGWLALAFYLALYFAAFVALARVAVRHLRISPIVAVPVVWTGLEWAQAHVLGGFAMASLAHTQYRWPQWIQISDIFGQYGVSFAIVLVAACVARAIGWQGARWAWWPVVPLAATLAAVAGYGWWHAADPTIAPGPKVALIQGSIDIEMKHDPTQAQRIFNEYLGLSQQAVRDHKDLALVVWPETMFREPWFTFDKDYRPPADARWTPADIENQSRLQIQTVARALDVPCLLGIDTLHYTASQVDQFNTALFIDRQGNVLDRYDKCHLVPFGEYVPLGETFPWLKNLTPLPSSACAGSGPRSVEIGGVRYSANICYENTLPHIIRGQVAQLRAEGREPDVLVNLTNDGWYWGSSELDMHLACAVFRAVECRKPFLIAANTGFSAWIDSDGRIVAQGPRRATGVIVATLAIGQRTSWYTEHGDVPAAMCCLAIIPLAIVGLIERRRRRQVANAANARPRGQESPRKGVPGP